MKIGELVDVLGGDLISRVEAELRRLARENPTLRYSDLALAWDTAPRCYYNRRGTGDDTPGCIFGQALKALGWDDEDELEQQLSIKAMIPVRIPDSWEEVQQRQDAGQEWGFVIELLGPVKE